VVNNGSFTLTTITSEDSIDNDNNDSYLVIAAFGTAADASAVFGEFQLQGKEETNDGLPLDPPKLSLHAKTYYSGIEGGDENNSDINMDFVNGGPVSHITQSTGFRTFFVNCFDDRTSNPIFNYLMVSITMTDCIHDGMQNARCVLSAYITYIGSTRPTGRRTMAWVGNLSGTSRTLTRVTD
jgi:hypothetical protein